MYSSARGVNPGAADVGARTVRGLGQVPALDRDRVADVTLEDIRWPDTWLTYVPEVFHNDQLCRGSERADNRASRRRVQHKECARLASVP
jgi:hypothetical protein